MLCFLGQLTYAHGCNPLFASITETMYEISGFFSLFNGVGTHIDIHQDFLPY